MKSFFIKNKEIRWPIIQGSEGVISPSGKASDVAIVCAGLGLQYKQNSGDYLKNYIRRFKEELRKVHKGTKGIFCVFLLKLLIKQGCAMTQSKKL